MSKQPLISIITICYNSQDTIERTIDSVLKQEFMDYEYIIVDGASTDGTIDIIKRYESLFEGRMHWKSEPDSGIYNAFNKGIAHSTGQYIWIVNSDDYLEADALQTIAENVPNDSEPILCFATKYIRNDGTINFLSSYVSGSKYGFIRDWAITPHTSIVVPKRIYDMYGVYDETYKIMADVDWMHRIYKLKVPFLHFQNVITNFTEGGISTTNKDLLEIDRKYYFIKNYRNPIVRYIHKFIWEKL